MPLRWPRSTLSPPVWTPTLLRNDRGLAASLKRSWRSWSTGGGRRLRRGSGSRKYFWTAGRSAKAQQESKFFFGKKKNKTGITDCYGQEFCRIPQVPNVQLETLGSVERHKVGEINKVYCVFVYIYFFVLQVFFTFPFMFVNSVQSPRLRLGELSPSSVSLRFIFEISWKNIACKSLTFEVSVEMVVLVRLFVRLLLVMNGGVSRLLCDYLYVLGCQGGGSQWRDQSNVQCWSWWGSHEGFIFRIRLIINGFSYIRNNW